MQLVRAPIASDPRDFGRGLVRDLSEPAAPAARPRLSDDFKLFLTTFLGGFVFVSILLA
jgi:hypothetical protein